MKIITLITNTGDFKSLKYGDTVDEIHKLKSDSLASYAIVFSDYEAEREPFTYDDIYKVMELIKSCLSDKLKTFMVSNLSHYMADDLYWTLGRIGWKLTYDGLHLINIINEDTIKLIDVDRVIQKVWIDPPSYNFENEYLDFEIIDCEIVQIKNALTADLILN